MELEHSLVANTVSSIEQTRLLQTLVSVKKILEGTKRLGDKENWFFGTEVLLNCYEQATLTSLILIDELLEK